MYIYIYLAMVELLVSGVPFVTSKWTKSFDVSHGAIANLGLKLPGSMSQRPDCYGVRYLVHPRS
jgi:hypothetical protein